MIISSIVILTPRSSKSANRITPIIVGCFQSGDFSAIFISAECFRYDKTRAPVCLNDFKYAAF